MRKPPEGRKSSFYGSPDNPGVTPGRLSRLNVFRLWRAVSLELLAPEGLFLRKQKGLRHDRHLCGGV